MKDGNLPRENLEDPSTQDCSDERTNNGYPRICPVRLTFTLNGQDSVCNSRSQVSAGVQAVSRDTTERHTNAGQQEEYEYIVDTITHASVAEAQNDEYKGEGDEDFFNQVDRIVANSRCCAEAGFDGARIVCSIELIQESNPHKDCANETAQHLSQNIAPAYAPIHLTGNCQANTQGRVQMCAGNVCKQTYGQCQCKTPTKGESTALKADLLSKQFATTPSPKKTRKAAPKNSARYMLLITVKHLNFLNIFGRLAD